MLSPLQAVLWAAFFNFAAFFLVGTSVAKTVGGDMVNLEYVTPITVLAGLVSSAAALGQFALGSPDQCDARLIGGYASAAMARVVHIKAGLSPSTPFALTVGRCRSSLWSCPRSSAWCCPTF